MKAEVEERRQREEFERQKYVTEAKERQIQDENIGVREERSRQIHQALPNDWKYQMDLKNQETEREKLAMDEEAIELRKSITEEKRIEEMERQQKKNENLVDEQKFTADLDRLRFQQNQIHVREVEAEQSKNVSMQKSFDAMDQEARDLETSRKEAMKNALETQMDRKQKEEMSANIANINYEKNLESKNVQFMQEHARDQKEEIHKNNEIAQDFLKYNQEIDKRRHLESNMVSSLIHKERGEKDKTTVDLYNEEIAKRNHARMLSSNYLRSQIKHNEAMMKRDQESRRKEEERRLIEESKYASHLQDMKEQKRQQQIKYRQYLASQINEKNRIKDKLDVQSLDFEEKVKLAENQNNADNEHQIQQVQVPPM